jgi:hypothetical protein
MAETAVSGDKRILNGEHTARSDDVRESEDERDSGYSRAYTRVLTSTLFDILDYVSPDDHEWTQGLLKDYGKIEVKGPEGDVPEQPPFAKDIVFWVMLACASFLGVAMGFAGLIFLNIIDEVREIRYDPFLTVSRSRQSISTRTSLKIPMMASSMLAR